MAQMWTSSRLNIVTNLTMTSRTDMEKIAFEKFREMARKAIEERKNHPNEEAVARFKDMIERIKKSKEDMV